MVISLQSKPERRTHITQEFSKQGIDFEFFDAITPDQVAKFAARHSLALDGAFLTEGEKACFMSHVCLWQQMIDEDLEYLAVFEDDIYLGENAHLFFNDDEWLRVNGLDFVKTETVFQERKLGGSGIDLADGRKAYPLFEFHYGAGGYIINLQGAQVLINHAKSLSSNEILPIDDMIFGQVLYNKILPIHQIMPAIVIQECIINPSLDNFPSSLEADRDARRKNKPKRSLTDKIKGELSNAFRKTFGKLSRTKITFR